MNTASTAPLAGSGRATRLGVVRFVRRAIGPTIGGAHGSIERRAFWHFSLVIPLANLCGALDVFFFLWFVFPLPAVDNLDQARLVNLIAFAVTLVVTFVVCGSLCNKYSEPVARWLDAGKPADEAMMRYVLRMPLRLTAISAAAWVGGALAFAIINSFFSLGLGVLVGIGILLGGMTTCGLMYLLAEKALVPITARALSSTAPRKPELPGVDARVLVTFAVTTAGPLLSLVALAVVVLAEGSVSATRLALTALVLALAALLFGLAAMKLVARSFATSLRSMRDAVARVERGDLGADVAIFDGSEMGVLQAGFNSMVAGLREREELRDLFGRHVGADVARSALERGAELGGEQREVAVLFVDLVGSTTLAAERSPDEVLCLLNRYFGLVVDVAGAHNGWVNKFEGDGALCVFGAPHDMADPAGCALSAARELHGRLRAEVPELRAAIGVSAGTVVAGNVGSAERFEYTVIGDPVNEASRLTQLAKGTPVRLLASAATLRCAGEDERALWRPDGQATLRGRPEPTKLVIPV